MRWGAAWFWDMGYFDNKFCGISSNKKDTPLLQRGGAPFRWSKERSMVDPWKKIV